MGSTRSGKASREGRRDPMAAHNAYMAALEAVYVKHGITVRPVIQPVPSVESIVAWMAAGRAARAK